MGGQPILLLTTTGRRSGVDRTTPVQYTELGNHLVIVAANGGRHAPPAWCLNLQAEPRVSVQIESAVGPRRARVTEGTERAELWRQLIAKNRYLAGAQEKAKRELPVVVLER